MREQIRVWTEAVETFVLEVIHGQRRDRLAAVARGEAIVSVAFGGSDGDPNAGRAEAAVELLSRTRKGRL